MSYVSVGSLGAAGGTAAPRYYAAASSLRWTSQSFKSLHGTLKNMDSQWRHALSIAPLDLIPDPTLRQAAQQMSAYPAPFVSELALALEVIGGNRPLDELTFAVLQYGADRMTGSAGIMAAFAGTTGALAGALALIPVDLGISAATLGTMAAISAGGAAALGLAGAILNALADGQLPRRDDLKMAMRLGATATGAPMPSDDQIDDAYDTFGVRADGRTVADFRAAKNSAIARSKRKADACRAKGGVFDPKAPDGCRIVKAKPPANSPFNPSSSGGGNAPSSSGGISPYVLAGGAVGVATGLYMLLRKR